MRKIDLGPQGDGPYRCEDWSPYSHNTEFYVQAFAEEGKAVFIFSETPQNYSDPYLGELGSGLGTINALRETLNKLGIKDMRNVEVIYHEPENVTGDNPERFAKVTYTSSDLNNLSLHEDYSRRQELTPEEVAEKIGPENFVEKQYAQAAAPREEYVEHPTDEEWEDFQATLREIQEAEKQEAALKSAPQAALQENGVEPSAPAQNLGNRNHDYDPEY